MKLKQILQILLLVISCSTFAQTTYVFTGPGNWNDTTKWSSYPGTTIANTDRVEINGGLNLNVEITNNGWILFLNSANENTLNARINNDKNINNQFSGLTTVSSGANVTVKSSGTIRNIKNGTLSSTVTVGSGGLLKIDPSGVIINEASITNFGTIQNNGLFYNNVNGSSISNFGAFVNSGSQAFFGTLSNATVLIVNNNSATFTNENGAEISMLVGSGFFISNTSTLINQTNATFTSNGQVNTTAGSSINNASNASFTMQINGRFTHSGTFTNNSVFNNSGETTIFNSGVFSNGINGQFTTSFRLYIENDFVVNNGTTINNVGSGRVEIRTGASLLNNGIINTEGVFVAVGTDFINNNQISNSGTLSIFVASGATNNGTIINNNTFSNGALFTNNNTLTNNGVLNGNTSITNNGVLNGTNTSHTSMFNNQSELKPGSSPGTYTFDSTFTQDTNGTLFIEIAGTTPGTAYDQVLINSGANLGGTLQVSLLNGYTPLLNDAFDILISQFTSGTFDTLQLPSLSAGLEWEISYTTTTVTLTVVMAPSYFETIWQTTSDGETITIPTAGGGINYNIDWGDGVVDTNVSGDATHVYATADTYTVKIDGDFRRIRINDGPDKDKILSVENWGAIAWESLGRAFKGCTNLVINATDTPDLSNTTSLAGMFDGATSMNSPIGNWDVSTIENMDGMFRNTPFNQDISGWDVSSVSAFLFMFDDAAAFNQNISGWTIRTDVPVNMASMFRGATDFDQNLGGWDVSSVTNMVGMFERCSNFNGNIGLWGIKTSNVENMAFMFKDATSFNDDISTWNTDSVTDMVNMFSNATVFNQEIGSWNVSNVTVMISMFEDATNFNGNISGWDVTNVEEMFAMFSGATSFNQPIGSWGTKTANVFDFGLMFKGATAFNQDISSWSTGASDYFDEMFSGASSFNQPIGNWDVTGAEFMAFAFENATAFNQDVSGWDISNVTDVFGMFDGVSLSTSNYDALLTAWSMLTLQSGLQFSGGNSQYCASVADRTAIINNFGWSIGDGGIEVGCQPLACTSTTTYTGGMWDNGAPNINTTAIINSNYSTEMGSLDACTLVINDPAIVTVAPLTYINTLGNITVAANAELIITHTGSVVQADGSASTINNGEIEVQITTPLLKPRDFMVLGSPMTNDVPEGTLNPIFRKLAHSTSAFQPHPDVQALFPDGTNFVDLDQNDWATHSTVFSSGEGYLVWPQASMSEGNLEYPLVFSQTSTQGTLNNGDVSYVLGFNTPGPTAIENKNASPNIISNPYPSAISATDFILANDAVDEVYFWEHNTTPSDAFPGGNSANFNMADISVFNELGGVPASTGGTIPNDFISTGQGFGIKNNGSAANVLFTNAMRRKTNNTTLREPNEIQKDRIWLSVKNAAYNLGSTTLIGFIESATGFFEAAYDSPRLGTPVSIYSHIIDGSKALAIQGRESFTINATVGIGFSSQIDQDNTPYTIAISQREGIQIEQASVYLKDNVLGTITNISESPYHFTSGLGTFNNRFTLLFEDEEVLGTTESIVDGIKLAPNPTTGIVTITSPRHNIQEVLVYDLLGRLVLENNSIENATTQIDISDKASGVYLLDIHTLNGLLTKKIIKE